MSSATDTALAHPVRQDSPDQPFPWRDNAYLAFWDPGNEVFGAVHVSTSPNAQGRRARASVSVRGRSAELMEELPVGGFAGESITFGLDGVITVRSAKIELDLTLTPRHALGDYTASEVIPPLVEGEPLHHFQQGMAVTGRAAVRDGGRGEQAEVAGTGLRDRTWGFRDESAMIREYVAVLIGLPDADLTVMKFRGNSGPDRVSGFLLGERAEVASGLTITRDAAGLLVGADVELAGGQRLELRRTRFTGGFWVPMGVERTGPTMAAYDEFLEVRTADGRVGHGVVEQGIRRELY